MPLEHLDLQDEEIEEEVCDVQAEEDHRTSEERTLDAEQKAARMAKATPSLIAPVEDPVTVALANLRDAVLSGDVDAIGLAQEVVEAARLEALRLAQRKKDLNLATVEAQRLKSAKAAEARRKLGDDIEARLRKRAPFITFQCPGNRTVRIKCGGQNLEPQVSTEAIRRLAHAMNVAHADQIAASRAAGRSVPVRNFLATLITDEAGGLAAAIKLGICKITKGK